MDATLNQAVILASSAGGASGALLPGRAVLRAHCGRRLADPSALQRGRRSLRDLRLAPHPRGLHVLRHGPGYLHAAPRYRSAEQDKVVLFSTRW